MNPEFLRNLWLEATPFRLVLIAGILLLLFSATGAVPGIASTQSAALAAYWFFVVLWGTRSAALSVVGEIRERTWDSQKLSAIGPVEMVWGKLLGSTIHNWFGGLICLPFIVLPMVQKQGVVAAVLYAVILVALGVFAQATALLSSLVLIRRQTGNWRLDTFLCQVAGILAAFAYYTLWSSSDAYARSTGGTVSWWGHDFNLGAFHLASLLLFCGWVLMGCWRAMRAELRFTNGPFVWLGWLAYMALYQAGFESLLGGLAAADKYSAVVDPAGHIAVKLGLAGGALLMSTYSMAFLEPKDPVRLRWLAEQVRAGRLYKAFLALDAWMLSLGATLVVGIVLAGWLAASRGAIDGMPLPSLVFPVLALLGLLVRDVAMFVLMRAIAGGKGDFAALAVLGALYLLVPIILHGAELDGAAFFFVPLKSASVVGVTAAWAQGLGVAWWAIRKTGAAFTSR